MSKYLLSIVLLMLPAMAAARWIDDIVTMQHDAVGTIEFSHYNHLEALGNDCVMCHNTLFDVEINKNKPVSMADMEMGKSCGACHNGIKAFSVSENCATCHPTRTITFTVEEGDASFSHEIHTALYGCGDCHPDVFAPDVSRNQTTSMADMADGQSCGACHDGDTAFTVEENCETCHDM